MKSRGIHSFCGAQQREKGVDAVTTLDCIRLYFFVISFHILLKKIILSGSDVAKLCDAK